MPEELSVKDRWFIVHASVADKKSVRAISKDSGHGRHTVRRWLKRFKETGDVQDFPRPGQPRKSTAADDAWLTRASRSKRESTSIELNASWERARGVHVDDSTVRRRLIDDGLYSLRPRQVPNLTEKQKNDRVRWAKKHKKRAWSKVLMTDEKTFQLGTHTKRVRREKGEEVQIPTPAHPPKVHVWGGVSEGGFSEPYIFTENLTGELLCTVYEQALLPSAARLFKGQWSLVEDNDPKHKSRKATQWRRDHHINRLPWPAYSADLNAMENVWPVLQNRVAKRHPQTINGLRKVLKEEWAKLPATLAHSLLQSMPKRCQAVVDGAGRFIRY
jgi:transposase